MIGREREKNIKEKKIPYDNRRGLGEQILLDLSLIIIPDFYNLDQLYLLQWKVRVS